MLFCLALLSKYPVIQSAQEGKVVLVPLLYFLHQKTNPLRGPYQNSGLSLCRICAAAKEAFFHLQMNGRYFIWEKGFSLEKTDRCHINTIMQIILFIAVVRMVHLRTTI